MNLLLLRPEEVLEARVVLSGRRAAHVHSILRSSAGERIRIGVLCESTGTAEVASSEPERLELINLELTSADCPPTLRLIIALPRPKALKRLLQTAASFGVAHIDLVNAWRVQKSYWDSPAVDHGALERELLLGCEQGRHPWLPSIATHRLLMPFLDVEAAREAEGPRLLTHPGCEVWMSDVAPQAGATIAVGPEGGWIAKELSSFEGCGFQKISVSSSILRSEIALAATLAQWEMVCHRSLGRCTPIRRP